MGWWKVQGTEDVVGDDAFELVRSATIAVAELYAREFGRPPTRTEWQRLILDSLASVSEGRSELVRCMFSEALDPTDLVISLESERESQ